MGFINSIKKRIASIVDAVENVGNPHSSNDSDNKGQNHQSGAVFDGTPFERSVVTFDDRKRMSYPSTNGLYVAEILLLEYCSYGTYPNPQNGYPGFWWFEYGISDVDYVLNTLRERGFIRFMSAKESVPKLNITEIKNILSQLGLPLTGKKNDLVARLQENATEDQLQKFVFGTKYTLTDAGQCELATNVYVPYMHKNRFKTSENSMFGTDFNVWSINKLVHQHPEIPYRDLIWGELNRFSLEYAKHKQWGLYRNARYHMYDFLMEEDRYRTAFPFLAETLFYDLNSEHFQSVSPGLITALQQLTLNLEYTNDEMEDVLRKRFQTIFVPYHNYSADEVICIIVSYAFGQNEIAENLLAKKQ